MDEIKRIKFERSGGFANIRFAADFELDDLPDDQTHQLRDLLDELDFDELPAQLSGATNTADGFTYVIAVEFKSRTQTVSIADGSVPEKLTSLLDLLTQITKQQMRKK